MEEREIDVTTADGLMKTFIYHPTHDGPHPVVLYLMDAPSIRPVLKDMANRLASAGYYVMLPYLFYRGGPFREFGQSDEDMHARRELMETVNPTNIVGDAQALLDYADGDPAARRGSVGVVGFCMSGGLALSVARALPNRVTAAASIHGAWLVRDTPDSPHLGLDKLRAEVYFGWADNDPTAPGEHVAVMTEALEDADVPFVLDFLTDAVHGYAPPGTERYNRAASELHWERVHDLLRRRVQAG
jgi:carboxymethylenebutenolidase